MHIFWAIIGCLFIYLDLKKTSLIKLVLANVFIFESIFAYKFPKNYAIQITAFILMSIIFYFLIKNILKNEQKEYIKSKNNTNYINQIATVTKDIGKTLSIDGLGIIEINKETWSAKSIDDKEIKAGQKVKIISKENLIFNVEVINNAKN